MKFYGMRGPKFFKLLGWHFMFYLYRDGGPLPEDENGRRELAMRVEFMREKKGWCKNRIERIKALRALRPTPLVDANRWVMQAFDRDGLGDIL